MQTTARTRPAARSICQGPSRLGVALCLAGALLAAMGAGCGRDSPAEIRKLQAQGRFAESLRPLREQLLRRPADAELNLLYGRALLQVGRAGGAVWPLRRAAEDPEHAVEAGLLLAGALLQGGSASDAIAAADEVLELDPESRPARLLRARAQVGASHNEEAIEELDALLAEWPDDSRLRALRIIPLVRLERFDDAEAALGELRETFASGELTDPVYEALFCAAEATFLHERGKREEAGVAWQACLDRHETNPTVVSGALQFYRTTGQRESARELMRRVLDRDPENSDVRVALAALLRAEGDAEAGRRLMEEATREFPSAEQWAALADYHMAEEDYAAARRAMERVIEMLPDMPPDLRFAYADLLVLAGDPDPAEEMLDSLELQVQRDLVRGRIQLARGDARGALASLEEGVRYWPNNAAARYLAGQAAERSGEFDRAVSHFREAVRVNAGGTDAAKELVALHMARGTPLLAVEPLRMYLLARPEDVEAWRLRVRQAAHTGDGESLRRALARIRARDPAAAAVELAALRREAGDPAAAVRVLEKSGLDWRLPAHAEALEALVEAHITAGSAERGREAVEAALAAEPEAAVFHAIHGRALLGVGDEAGARAAFERALELDAERADALEGLAALAATRGDREQALELYDRAAAADPSALEPVIAAAGLAASGGDPGDAVRRFEAALQVDPLHAPAARRLAELLAEQGGDLERALDLARRAVALGGGSIALETVAHVQIARGEGSAALATLREVLEEDPDRAPIQYWLGRALALTGDTDAARAAYRKALEGGEPPEAARARDALAKLDAEASG